MEPWLVVLKENSTAMSLISNIVDFTQILNRHPPFGNQIRESVIHLPKYEVTLEQVKDIAMFYCQRHKYVMMLYNRAFHFLIL